MKETVQDVKGNELTAREKEYLEYWIQFQHIRPTKRLLIVTWSLFGVFVFLFLPIFVNQKFRGESSELWLLVLLILVIFLGCLLHFTIGLRERMKRLETADYEVYRRTKIIKKEIQRINIRRGPIMKIPYYLCEGVKGQVTPVSKEFYDATKPGDDVTVVKIEVMAAFVGITFPEEANYVGKE